MFVDKVNVVVKAGEGGSGAVSFRHEIYVEKGGPDGGDGGNGGDVVVVASRNQNTLATFRYQKLITAENGQNGTERKKHGRSAKALRVLLPVGTIITDANGVVLADLTNDGLEVKIASGGRGGFGNAHFKSSTRQTPRVAEKGEPTDDMPLVLELKMIADVGLVGLPNAGKSTLLSVVSNARPAIANYPFTTLIPNLGVVDVPGQASLLMADIPGLIEGASDGKGLGYDFLRHVERTSVLIHLIDVYDEDLAKSYITITNELAQYSTELSQRRRLLVLTKIEGMDKELLDSRCKELQKASRYAEIFCISAAAKLGLQELIFSVSQLVSEQRNAEQVIVEEDNSAVPVISLLDADDAWQVSKTEYGFMVTGVKVERFGMRTNFDNAFGVERLRDILRKMGVMHQLERQKINVGDQVHIGKYGHFKY